jgi:hypothetical protein
MTVAQTPGIWVDAMGDAAKAAACVKALKECGVDPGSFGSYSQRLKAQNALRQAGKDKSVPNSKMKGKRAQEYLTANSQSGHMAQNAWFQLPGGRDDACMNVPPANGTAGAPSAYGYTCGGAPCTDHFGKSSVDGTCHGTVSIQVERDKWGKTGSAADIDKISTQVKASADVHVDAKRSQKNADPADKPYVDSLANAQQKTADHLQGKDSSAGPAGGASPAKPGSPAGASGPGPSAKTKQLAAECEVAMWKSMMEKMRANAINSSGIAKAAKADGAIPKGKEFTDLPAAKQKELVEKYGKKQFGEPPPAPKASSGIPKPPDAKPCGPDREPATKKPTKKDCLEYQKNYLAWQTANNTGNPPPWGGQVPPSSPASTSTGKSKPGKSKE